MADAPTAMFIADPPTVLGLLTEEGIDGALSPRTATANAVLRFVLEIVLAKMTGL